MTRMRVLALGMAVTLVCTVAFGALSHSIIPHSHSHDGQSTDVGWEILHSALRHEEKKSLALMAADLLVLVVIALVYGAATARVRLLLRRERYQADTNDPLRSYVRTGVAAYRRFG